MNIGQLHKEDVKAVLRKRHGTVAAFEALRGLPRDSVSDLLRGRNSARVAEAVADELNKAEVATGTDTPDDSSDLSDCKAPLHGFHRLSAGRE